MGKQWSYFIFLAWLTYLMISGVILFTRGFLLNRISRLEVGDCKIKLQPCDIKLPETCLGGINIVNHEDLFKDEKTAAETCLGKQARVIWLIIDALRYDFALWNDNITSQEHSYNQNKMPVIKQALKTHPDRTKLYKFIADPPTTTMQRLKGLTTGTLPTFIDAGSNFATEDINEDNIIDQASSQGIVFIGDDTWMSLYPDRFLRYYPYPSFNVWDLDTVDNGVENHIFNELKNKDWSLLVAHTLGVDHCGHRYGPNHPEMERKLKEMNNLIEKLIKQIDNDTMLIVVGDHGMTSTGDHGGDGRLEIEAAMFVYSSIPLLAKNFGNHLDENEVYQIDLVPTLASILGIPVPFSNLGTTIVDILPIDYHKENNNLEDYHYALHSVWSNVVQIKNYVEIYSAESSIFSKEKLDVIRMKFDDIYRRVKTVNNFESFQLFYKDSKDYLNMIRIFFVEVWVQFDSSLMIRGLGINFFSLLFSYLIIDGIPRDRLAEILQSNFLYYNSILANLTTITILAILFSFNFIQDFQNNVLFATGMISVFIFGIIVIKNWNTISINLYNKNEKARKWLEHSSIMIFLLSLCGLFSNSYVIEESLVLCFLLITLIWLLIVNVKDIRNGTEKRMKSAIKAQFSKISFVLISSGLVATILIRLSSYFWSCRDEQQRSCDIFDLRKPGAIIFETSSRVVVIITLIIIALFITVIRIWLKSCGNLTGFSPNVTATRYLPSIIVVCMGCYWVLQHLPKDAKVKLIKPWQVDMLTWVVYSSIIIGILLITIFPLYVYLLPKKKESLNVYGRDNIIPQLFNGMKGLIYKKKDNDIDSTPVVYGLGTVYSSTFITLSIFCTLLCTLMLGHILAPSIIIMYIVCICVLVITAIERYQQADNIDELLHVPTPSLICWFLISEYFFYATGHQPTFPKIHWDAAFVGTGGIFHTNVIPAALIGINTFGSHLLLGITLPVIVIAPFTLYFMFPSIARGKSQQEKDLRRGEFLLYENEGSLLSSTFTVSAKYMIFHGLRTFCCMLAATMHSRHLMVWSIFSPKLIFQGLSFAVTMGSVLFSYLLLIRLHRRIDKLFTRMSKIR